MTKTANEEWLDTLRKIVIHGSEHSPRGYQTLEILANQTKIDMNFPIVSVPDRKMGFKFMFAEAWWILSGKKDVESIAPYSKMISSFSDNGHTFDGAYGPMFLEQVRYAVDSLVEDPETRQSIISIWRPNPRASKDIPCTLSLQFIMREGRLHCNSTMRSSDIWLGWVYDVFNFSMMASYVLLLAQEKNELFRSVILGDLSLTAGSQHLYERDFAKAQKIVKEGPTSAYRCNPNKFLTGTSSAKDLIHKLEFLKDDPESFYNSNNLTKK